VKKWCEVGFKDFPHTGRWCMHPDEGELYSGSVIEAAKLSHVMCGEMMMCWKAKQRPDRTRSDIEVMQAVIR